jgi:hypothetical protein
MRRPRVSAAWPPINASVSMRPTPSPPATPHLRDRLRTARRRLRGSPARSPARDCVTRRRTGSRRIVHCESVAALRNSPLSSGAVPFAPIGRATANRREPERNARGDRVGPTRFRQCSPLFGGRGVADLLRRQPGPRAELRRAQPAVARLRARGPSTGRGCRSVLKARGASQHARASVDRQHQLPGGAAGLAELMGAAGLGQWEGLGDRGAQAPGFDEVGDRGQRQAVGLDER